MKTMNPYESELIAIAKARGDSISRQLVDVLIVKHAEIEALRKYVGFKDSGYDIIDLSNQEPVAWQWLDTANFRKSISDKANKNEWRPLYTEPQYRELSDLEMISIYEKDWSGIKCGLGRAVEKAILKKANKNEF